MSPNEFNLLDQNNKVKLIYRHGIYIGKERLNNNIISLYYQLNGFYVNLTYSTYRYTILEISLFRDPEPIYKFLDQINVDEVLHLITFKTL